MKVVSTLGIDLAKNSLSPELPPRPPWGKLAATRAAPLGSDEHRRAPRIAIGRDLAGIQICFDREELRGGDAWDRRIREQIHACRLFIPVISAHTEARDEGYFRREWKLAVDRTHDMADTRAFLVPVVIDRTTERGAS